MKYKAPVSFIAALIACFLVATGFNVAVQSNSYSETYPAVVCPPTLNGLNSQISISSGKTQYQRLQNRSSKTLPFKTLRFPVSKDSLVISAEGVTPVIWQSRSGSWAGGTICSGPVASQWFVGGSANVTTRGRLVLTNSGLSDAIVDIQSYSENGKQPIKSVNLNSKSFMQLSLDSLAPGDKSLTIQVVPRSGRVNSFVIDEQGAGLRALGGDFVNSYTKPTTSIVIPAIPNQLPKKGQKTSSSHTLRILSPGEVDTNFTVEVLSADGRFTPVGLNSRRITAGVVSEFSLTPNISASAFAVRITSPDPIVAAISSSVTISGHKDFVWSTATPELMPMTIAITGLSPLIAFTGDSIAVRVEATLINGKKVRKAINGTDIATWRAPANARSMTIVSTSKKVFAGALVASSNGYGFFPIENGSVLTKVEVPNSNIRVLNP
ncbi:MAG: hypothetical protein F2690_02695 [Actinobacteria bacterium]|uniref:Unannotated protein n=1 Tax=freshwater metagenome TaxID=449393 RepID=A0A6J6RV02_9ZZZZ|nr:hypothetical protein [Actinomycetota bacterium]MSX72555.1 hypothetical protein [Actinomycetota bacterium]MSY69460.1 hypothetical protein [Actinomycetota bacterium]MTA75811.1 hypothetical protein [Actinomycetota bacterium]